MIGKPHCGFQPFQIRATFCLTQKGPRLPPPGFSMLVTRMIQTPPSLMIQRKKNARIFSPSMDTYRKNRLISVSPVITWFTTQDSITCLIFLTACGPSEITNGLFSNRSRTLFHGPHNMQMIKISTHQTIPAIHPID